MGYYDVYQRRTNRYGTNTSSRLENARRENFERFLTASPHYITFEYKDSKIECVFEPYRQNETKTLMHVLVRATQNFDIGEIVTIDDDQFMFYWLDQRRNSGYNRYVAVRMSHEIKWTQPKLDASQLEWNTSLAYFYSQQDNMLKNELRSRSRSDTLYLENLKLSFLLMPLTENIGIEDYILITTLGIEQAYVVTGFDIASTPGIMYVSIDPIPVRNLTPSPQPELEDSSEEFFWLTGGAE